MIGMYKTKCYKYNIYGKSAVNLLQCIFLINSQKEMTHALAWVKTIKSYATIPLPISFPWAKEGKPQAPSLNTLKYSKVHPF